MSERVFRSPGFFEQEIDLSQTVKDPLGIPAGVIGASEKGPAFVPVSVGSYQDFKTKFGSVNSKYFGPYAVKEFLNHRSAVTYLRVLGAGANETLAWFEKTRLTDQVVNAGFVVTGTVTADPADTRHQGSVQFIVANHFVSSSELAGIPMFSDNDSFNDTNGGSGYNIVRGMVLMASSSRLMIMHNSESFSAPGPTDDSATIGSTIGDPMFNRFKLVISSSVPTFGNDEKFVGIRILTASLDPGDQFYISKVLNTDPEKFATEQHLLYLDLAVDNEVAAVNGSHDSVAVVSGSAGTSVSSGDTTMLFRDAFGHFDTRFKAPKTPWFISQPFGEKEYDLFRFEAISDGVYSNDKIKISISNIRASTNPLDEHGSFNVQIRSFEDTDLTPQVIEEFPNLSLDPKADNYIAKVIGNKKVWYNFDAEREEERRLVVEGKYPNNSQWIRVIMHDNVEKGAAPTNSVPFGFRGPTNLKTSNALNDYSSVPGRLSCMGNSILTGSIVPPVPYRFKVTRGNVSTTLAYAGQPGTSEIVDSRFYWGVKFERNNTPLNPNTSAEINPLVRSLTKYQGLEKLDVVVTGSGLDDLNNNKFTLARVALYNSSVPNVTGTVDDHMIQAAYIRNATWDSSLYRVSDGTINNRITFASLIQSSSAIFNRFSSFAKFTTILQGGFDGVNILDKNAKYLNDRASSTATGGGAASAYIPTGFANQQNGNGKTNNTIYAYRKGTEILTDPMASKINYINLLAIPGIRDALVTDYASDNTKDYGLALYVMDLEKFDDNNIRIFDDSVARPSARNTWEQFDSRAIDNSYVSTYFPDPVIKDEVNNQNIKVPASVAAMAALAFNDKVGFPWFAPAGFNRAALDFVQNIDVRLNSNDRNFLYDARINPIASFPRQGFVIFGQKTLQQAKSALDRVNVRRLMVEIKRSVIGAAGKIVFEPNTPQTRARFITEVTPMLAVIQSQSGIEDFRIIMDETNNTQSDIESNRLNGRIVVIPTKAVEFVSFDFIITNSGVSFV